MKILFSYPDNLENEAQLINKIVDGNNWDKFHLRKPNWSEKETNNLFNELSEGVRRITVIHKNFKGSCHSFKEVEELDGKIEYCFLSPVFDSISKQGYKANFNKEELKKFLKKERKIKIMGLGGVTEDNYSKLINLGFDGGAFLGSVWKQYE
jgi:thiamine-phosphate pyrophosphorylase